MNYVYVVNFHEFDDYHEPCHYTKVNAVFASKEVAEQYIWATSGSAPGYKESEDYYDIVEFPLFSTPHRLSEQEIRDADYDKALEAVCKLT